ncbi:hypothetical protein BD408DRAFT_415656 [Parasitella parasitica]|nr:hypothetical protein BD408DRAFT_415656 [Parasitella parasitica]
MQVKFLLCLMLLVALLGFTQAAPAPAKKKPGLLGGLLSGLLGPGGTRPKGPPRAPRAPHPPPPPPPAASPLADAGYP